MDPYTNKNEDGNYLPSMRDDFTNTTPKPLNRFPHLQNETPITFGSNDFILVDDVRPKRKISVKEKVDSFVPWVEQRAKSAFTMKTLYKRFPILSWMRTYNGEAALGDLLAGITVGLTVIPQSLAYSNIAGLPAQYGLYGSFLGSLMYIFIGSCKDVPMGPTAICSLLTYQTIHGLGPQHAILLCFLSGLIQLLMGIVGLGIIIDFVSGPVSSGFTAAVAILIICSQIKDILGITASGATLVDMIWSLSEDIENTKVSDTVMGLVTIVILLLMRKLSDINLGKDHKKPWQIWFNKAMWLIATSRNAILVILGGVIGYYYASDNSQPPFKIIGDVPPGLPDVLLPPFSIERDNRTVGFIEMVTEMGSGVFVLPLIALLENIAICKAFANGKSVDATQELIAIGLCNIGNSFVQGFPGSGSLSRSAVNNSSGVKTPLGSLYTGILVIVALLFFTPCFYYIPKAVLGGIIIAAVIFMIEVRLVYPIWKSKRTDLIPWVVTLVACLGLRLELGILIGIGINLISILYHAARPKIKMEINKSRGGVEYLLLTPDRCLVFPSVDYVSALVTKHSIKQGIPVVIDCTYIYGADFTAAKVIEMLCKDFSRRKQALFFYNVKSSVMAVFEGVRPKNFIVYYNDHDLDDLLEKHGRSLSTENGLKTISEQFI